MSPQHEHLGEPLEAGEARQVAAEIRRRMLDTRRRPETLEEVAEAMGASPSIAREALRTVRARRAGRRRLNFSAVLFLATLVALLGLALAGPFWIGTTMPAPVAPAAQGGGITDVTAPGRLEDDALVPPGTLGDWLVDDQVREPRRTEGTAPPDATEDARLLDAENARWERAVTQSGGNFDHLSSMRAQAGQVGPAGMQAKRAWNEVLRGNLRQKGLFPDPGNG